MANRTHIIGAVDSDQREPIPDESEDPSSHHGSARELPVGRVLGLDVGSRRIGVAVSDPLGITAQGLETLQRTTKRRDFEHLQRVIQEYDVREIVVGLPLRMSGAEGIQSDKMQVFAEELRKRFRLPVRRPEIRGAYSGAIRRRLSPGCRPAGPRRDTDIRTSASRISDPAICRHTRCGRRRGRFPSAP